MSHIHTPKSWIGRTMKHCTTCRQRRRFLVRLFEYYSSRWTCGGCGYTFVSGEGRNEVCVDVRQRNRKWVRDKWKTVAQLSDVTERLCDTIFQNGNRE